MNRKRFIKQSLAGSIFIPLPGILNDKHSADKGSSLLLNELEPIDITGEINDNRTVTGTVLNIGELVYENGLGTSVPAQVTYKIPDGYKRLEGWAGLDLTSTEGQATLKVLVDGETAFDSGQMQFDPYSRSPAVNADRAIKVSVPVDQDSTVKLVAEGSGGNMLANWAELRLLPEGWSEFQSREQKTEKEGTPPMGWNSWNAFGPDIDEETIHDIVDMLVEKGFLSAGYEYLNLDDGWQADKYRNSEGYPVYDKQKFPHGMKKLGEFIHNKGLKFGIYSRPDWVGGDHSFDGLWTGGNETKHAKTFAEWGVDYLKYDFGEKGAFWFMGQALKQVNRDIIYSVCGWGKEQEWQWAPSFGGNLWRTTYDVMAVWETGSDQNPVGIMDAVDQTEALGRFAGPGQWNDPDMLVVGLKGGTAVQDMHQNEISRLNKYEQRSQMSLYALLSAPLIIGGDIRHMDETAIETLLNKEVIAIDQDPLAVPAWRVLKLDEREVWKKPLEDGGYAIGLLNRGESPATIAASWRQLNLEGKYQVRDLWKHKEMGVQSGEISRSVKPHQTILLRFSPIK